MSDRLNQIAQRCLRAATVMDKALAALNDPFDNYQRQALREAMQMVFAVAEAFAKVRPEEQPGIDLEAACGAEVDKYLAAAVHILGDAIDHAHRDGYTETRMEVAVCVQAFQILTTKEQAA